MSIPYNHKAIEKKWRENWEKNPVNVKEDENGKKPKYYCLDMFPYPSGNGLHTGEGMLSPMYGADTNYCRGIISFIPWDGMRLGFRLKIMRLRWEYIRRFLPQRM